jgi:hypothetical protein
MLNIQAHTDTHTHTHTHTHIYIYIYIYTLKTSEEFMFISMRLQEFQDGG